MGLMFTFFMFLFKGVRNKEGQEYEPDTLTGFQNSIERHLKNNKVVVDLKRNDDFSHSRKVLEAKRKRLKQEGKGNKLAPSSLTIEQ